MCLVWCWSCGAVQEEGGNAGGKWEPLRWFYGWVCARTGQSESLNTGFVFSLKWTILCCSVVNPCAISPKVVLDKHRIAPGAAVNPLFSAELGFGLFGMQTLYGTEKTWIWLPSDLKHQLPVCAVEILLAFLWSVVGLEVWIPDISDFGDCGSCLCTLQAGVEKVIWGSLQGESPKAAAAVVLPVEVGIQSKLSCPGVLERGTCSAWDLEPLVGVLVFVWFGFFSLKTLPNAEGGWRLKSCRTACGLSGRASAYVNQKKDY